MVKAGQPRLVKHNVLYVRLIGIGTRTMGQRRGLRPVLLKS
jgi:hypothetical protein